MKFGKYGVFTFTDILSGQQLTDLARRVEALGYSTLWYPEAFTYETFAIGAHLLASSEKLIVASGIANIYARDPMTAVMGHNSLNAFHGGRFVLGLGVSHAPLVADVRGHEYKKPLATMKAYLDAMDQTWAGQGDAAPAKQVALAALGPAMSKLSAERTLGAFPYNITPAQVALSRAAMGEKGAIICEQKVCLCEDADQARAVARASLAMYLELPNYVNNFYRLGFTPEDVANGGSDRLMDAMVLWGDAAKIKAGLDAYFEQGADQVVIQPLRSDGELGPDYAALEALAD